MLASRNYELCYELERGVFIVIASTGQIALQNEQPMQFFGFSKQATASI